MAVDFTNGMVFRNLKSIQGKIAVETLNYYAPAGGYEDATVGSFRDNMFAERQSYPVPALKVYGHDDWVTWSGTGFDPALEPEFETVTTTWEPGA